MEECSRSQYPLNLGEKSKNLEVIKAIPEEIIERGTMIEIKSVKVTLQKITY